MSDDLPVWEITRTTIVTNTVYVSAEDEETAAQAAEGYLDGLSPEELHSEPGGSVEGSDGAPEAATHVPAGAVHVDETGSQIFGGVLG